MNLDLLKRLKFKNNSYSQEGEDLVIRRIFSELKEGFYVDVGAHHPYRFSNTAQLYQCGWKGINIEPNPDNFKLFLRYRKRDINLNIGISETGGLFKYYQFYESALNTFDENLAIERITNTGYKLRQVINVEALPLKFVLDKNLGKNINIDLLSIDVEGYDLSVLKSNDWISYQPKVIVIEIFNLNLSSLNENPIYFYLMSLGYKFFAKLYNSAIFIR